MSTLSYFLKRHLPMPFAVTACLLVSTPAFGIMSYRPGESIPDTFIGSGTDGDNVETRDCPDGSIAIGVMIHSRDFWVFDGVVSGLQLICTPMSDTGAAADSAPDLTSTAGRLSVNNSFLERYPRICPTGQALSGLRGRAGAVVDAISIQCGRFHINSLTGIVTKGETFNNGSLLFSPGGEPDIFFP